jgi:hypothetical protein
MRKFAMALLLLAAAVPCAWAQNNGVTAYLELGQDQYLPDEDVQLKVRIINRSGQPITLGEGNDWISFEVLGEHQTVMSKLGEMPVKGPFTLQSGEAITKEFNPTPYFDFRHPGTYTIGAIIKFPQWNQQVMCKPKVFTLFEGVPLADFGNLSFGVPPPPGVTNAAPVVRHYSLVRVTLMDQMKLYFKLTDDAGRTLRCFVLGRMVSFGSPNVQMDRDNNAHVLFQTGAKTFDYTVVDPNGAIVARQFHEYTDTRPVMHLTEDGRIFILGGRRLLTMNDIPAPNTGTARNP